MSTMKTEILGGTLYLSSIWCLDASQFLAAALLFTSALIFTGVKL